MPKGLTAATGMDALTHAIEGYITPGAWTMSDMFELKAIELVAAHLRNAVEDGSDPVARNGMAEAQYIAGMGFLERRAGHRPLDGAPPGGVLRHAARRGERHCCCPM